MRDDEKRRLDQNGKLTLHLGVCVWFSRRRWTGGFLGLRPLREESSISKREVLENRVVICLTRCLRVHRRRLEVSEAVISVQPHFPALDVNTERGQPHWADLSQDSDEFILK